jgi:hypothetical protein
MSKKRASFTMEQRTQMIEAYKKSELSVTEFACQNGIGRGLLSTWLMRYDRPPAVVSPPTDPPSEVVLQEVSLNQVLGQRPWAAEVVLPGGLTLRLDAQGQAQLLTHLLGRMPVC